MSYLEEVNPWVTMNGVRRRARDAIEALPASASAISEAVRKYEQGRRGGLLRTVEQSYPIGDVTITVQEEVPERRKLSIW